MQTHLVWQRSRRTNRRKVFGGCPSASPSHTRTNALTLEDMRVLAAMPGTTSALATITKLDPYCIGGSVSRLEQAGRATKICKTWVSSTPPAD